MGKTINLLTPLTDPQVNNDTLLMALADPVSGQASSATMTQLKKTIGTQRLRYTATGSEGSPLVIAALAQTNVLAIFREGAPLYDVLSAPDSVSYIWDGVNLTFGLALLAGERLLILYDLK